MTAKTPQDHKQPKDKPQTLTVKGVEVTIDPAIFDDLDMVEYLYDLQNMADDATNSFAIIPFLHKLLGDSYKQVKDALKDPETGRIGMQAVGDFVTELMQKVNPNS